MNAKRIGSLGLAILLVVGAFLVRRNMIDDDGVDDPESSVATTPDREDATAIVCITELEDVCDALATNNADLDVTIEAASVTMDRLAALDDAADAPLWLTIEPYPAMVDALRQGRGVDPIGAEVSIVGASRLGIAFPAATGGAPGPVAAITTHCGGQAIWRCVGDNTGATWSELGGEASWGTLRPSLGDVTNSALGLASLANAVAGYLGDGDVTRSRWEADNQFLTWFRPLSDASESVALSGGSPVRTMVTRPSALDAGATATFEVTALGATGDRLELNYPQPEMWVNAVIATPPSVAAPDGLVADLTAQLEAEGWESPAAAGPALPSASTLLALRTLWGEAT